MPRYAVCEKCSGMQFHAAGTFREFQTLEEFMKDPGTMRIIRLNERFKDTWKIVQWVEDEDKPHIVVHQGNSGGSK